MRVERFFTIRSDNDFYKEYRKYLENHKLVNRRVSKFFEETGIESKGYYCSNKQLQIVPTKHDEAKFANQLCKNAGNEGLRKFKINSAS